MKNLFLFITTYLTFVTAILAQEPTGGDICSEGKIRFFGQPGRLNSKSARLLDPTVQSLGDPTIDVTYYGLDLRVTHTPASLTGVATVALHPAASGASAMINQFFLDLNSVLKVDSVRGGSPARSLTFVHANNRLTITLPQTLSAGQTQHVLVYYRGVPVGGDNGFYFATHGTNRDPLIYTLSEPYGASNWFPCKDTPADKVDSSAVTVTAPAFFVSTSNGLLQGVTTNADGTRTYRWKNSYPIAQYLISIACSNYQQYDSPAFVDQGRTMPVVHYLFPEEAANVKPAVDETNNMLKAFSDLFGTYPFLREKYGHASCTFGGGMEHQTLSSMGPGAYSRAVIAHELGHQWFGNKITCRDWQNIWLNEGFASYTEAAYQEAINGKAGYQTTMANFMARARNASGTLYVQNVNSFNEIFNSSRTYAKGASVVHMLRGVLGDSAFYRGIRTYLTSPLAYSTAVTEDLQRVLEQSSGQNLGYFFRQWVYGEGFPTYQWSIAPITGTNQAVLLIQQPTGTNPTSFTMPVQVALQSAAGERVVRVFNDQPVQSFTVTASGPISGAVFDPNNWILKNVTQVGAVLATQEAVAIRVFPNPTTDQFTLAFSTAQAGPLTITVLNTLGQVVQTNSYNNVPVGDHRRTVSFAPNVPAGRYVVRLQTADGVRTAAVVK